MDEVVITGLGAIAANGVGKETFWEALREGRTGIDRISRFDPSPYSTQVAGEVPSVWFDQVGTQFLAKRSLSTQMVISAARMALEDGGLDCSVFSEVPSGVWVGISTTDMGVVEKEYALFQEAKTAKPYVLPASFPHAPASEIASELKCSGQVVTVSTSCPSGLFSIIFALESLLRGEAEVVLAGGGDAPITPFILACFSEAGLLPKSFNENPSAASRPFDALREGGVLAEGAGMVLMERAERARSRGANIYVAITGWGISNACTQRQAYKSMYVSLNQALRRGRISPEEVDYVCAHAPGDRLIDKAEVKAIKKVLGSCAYNLPVSSIKSMIGNPLAAAGPLQVVAASLAIRDMFVPPTINYQHPDPDCDLDCVPNRGRVARLKKVLVNLHGLGGTNASLVLTKY